MKSDCRVGPSFVQDPPVESPPMPCSHAEDVTTELDLLAESGDGSDPSTDFCGITMVKHVPLWTNKSLQGTKVKLIGEIGY